MRRFTTGFKRVGTLLALCALIAASLLTFPASVPWMIAVWLAWHSVLAWRGRRDWIPLAGCAAIVVAKGTWPTTGLVILGAVLLAVAALGVVRRTIPDASRRRRMALAAIAAVWIAWSGMVVDWNDGIHSSRRLTSESGLVACLGDSLTAG